MTKHRRANPFTEDPIFLQWLIPAHTDTHVHIFIYIKIYCVKLWCETQLLAEVPNTKFFI